MKKTLFPLVLMLVLSACSIFKVPTVTPVSNGIVVCDSVIFPLPLSTSPTALRTVTTQTRKVTNILLVTVPREIPYVTFDTCCVKYSDSLQTAILNIISTALTNNTMPPPNITGVQWTIINGVITTATEWIEIENVPSYPNAENWLLNNAKSWSATTGWTFNSTNSGKGYWGIRYYKSF